MVKKQNTLPPGEGSGVDPIPVPKHPTAATEKLDDLVGEMMEEWTETLTGESEKTNQNKGQAK